MKDEQKPYLWRRVMKILWRRRPPREQVVTELDGVKYQYKCPHRSPDSCDLVPRLRIPGLSERRPQRERLFHLPSIRTCCLGSEELQRLWWADVDRLLRGMFSAEKIVEIRRELSKRVR